VVGGPAQGSQDAATTSIICDVARRGVSFLCALTANGGAQGHIRVGPETVTDPAFLVTRPMEDFVTWVDTSKIRRKVQAYNDALDDYDLLNA
jgi:hypothetical protein